ncbi:MAG TPA: FtsQ-type POTRA domain-containing protein [Thermodesulfobacteriota bacterium]|nr:FtsQ-type POTRA domain-containing protein [Thermodesulfobacteriota bacterium]
MRDYKDHKPGRRVHKKHSGKRLIPRLIKAAAVLAAMAAILIFLRYSYRELLKTDYFGLKEIVVAGEKRVRKEEIVGLAGLRMGENILAMDLKRITERIEGQPWIERATVRRVLPGGVSIEVKEREPFAILKTDTFYYLDRGGTPFKELDKRDATNYPVITGFGKEEVENDELARDALMKTFDFIETEAREWPEELAISEINVNKNQGITIFSDSIKVKVGFGEYKIKIGRLKRVLDDLKAKGKTAGDIDLTYTGQVVVK